MPSRKSSHGQSSPIVLLHSLGTDATLWRHQIALLEAVGPTVTPESRGHGTTPWTGSASIAEWVGDLHRTIDEIGPVHLVGLSMGGMQAMAYASSYPEMVRSLVVANSFARLPADIADKRVADATEAIDRRGIGAYADTYLAQTLTRRISMDDYTTLRDAIAGMQPEAYKVSADLTFHGDLTAHLAAIQCPTLVLTGADDAKTPVSVAQEIASGIDGAELVTIENAGHLSCIENPFAFNREVTRFLRAVAAGNGATEARRPA